MRIEMAYGKSSLSVEVPDANLIGPLELKQAPALSDPCKSIEESLAHPIGTRPLGELARGKNSACVVICDITRPVPNRMILPPILRTLENSGIPRSEILILIATGLHRPNLGEELIELVGPEIAANYRVENHDGKSLEQHDYLGTTEKGVPVWIDQRYLAADLKITTGLIEPHLMAGYSGGRKLICPGIAALETVKVWHGPRFLEHPKADSGYLEGNPVHEENTRIALLAGCDFIVNVTLDKDRHVTKVVAGDMLNAFQEGVRFLEQFVKAELSEPCEIVLTSAAGYPLDTTFYQSIKGLTGALPAVKQGGTIILVASLTEGIGSPEFQGLFKEHANLEAFFQKIHEKDYFVMDQWQLEELVKVRRKADVIYVSDGISSSILNGLFVTTASSVESALEQSLSRHGPDARIAVIPKGPYVLPVLAAG